MLRIGVDFDNTIVCYDAVFQRVARDKGLFATSKRDLRDRLRATGDEALWTRLQGYVYGFGLVDAQPFPGVSDFFRLAQQCGVPIAIVSHRTRHPHAGPAYDLHQAARTWLKQHQFFDLANQVFLEESREAKLARIRSLECTHFIDDLPELLLEPGFPNEVERILFDPRQEHEDDAAYRRCSTWDELARDLLNECVLLS